VLLGLEVEGLAGVVLWLVLLGLLLWLEGCVLCGLLELWSVPPVCAARHKLASNRGDASHSFFIGRNLQYILLIAPFIDDRTQAENERQKTPELLGYQSHCEQNGKTAKGMAARVKFRVPPGKK